MFLEGAGHESKTFHSIPVSAGGTVEIEALLAFAPASPTPSPTSQGGASTPAATSGPMPVAVPKSKPKPLRCGKGKVKKRVKGKQRCVKLKRRNPRQHHKKHRAQR